MTLKRKAQRKVLVRPRKVLTARGKKEIMKHDSALAKVREAIIDILCDDTLSDSEVISKFSGLVDFIDILLSKPAKAKRKPKDILGLGNPFTMFDKPPDERAHLGQ